MIRKMCQRALKTARSFLRDQSGSIIIYTGAFMAIGLGGAALSIDIGRVVLLKTQMQNRADAGALAGAAQLDAQPNSIARATAIVTDSMTGYTTAAADQGELAVWRAIFYEPAEDFITRGAVTADDVAARFVEVLMERRALSFFYAPALNILTGKAASNFTLLDARAVAMSDPFICKAQPLMICNPLEDSDPTTPDAIPDNSFAGRSITLKQGIQGGGTWTAGNFGMLDLPTDADYSAGGANAVAAALSAEEPSGCYGYNIVTAPGAMVVAVSNAVNERFGMPVTDSTILPAPNVMNYPRDNVINPAKPEYDSTRIMGDTVWDIETYWLDNHGTSTIPSELGADATRYQVYLWEQGVSFWRKNGGKNVVVTNLDQTGKGYSEVVPIVATPDASCDPGNLAVGSIPCNDADPDDNWTDGWPPPGQTVSELGQDRRIFRVTVMNCVNNDVTGKGDYPSEGGYIEIFMTEQSHDPGDGAGIYGEFVRKLDPRISLEFHGNVRLTE